ncbi:MAG: Hpt domain-containing protein [Rhizobiales bacterium]|nr:Hpt domain-containing protein [Hyphomicrobiales bacterium]
MQQAEEILDTQAIADLKTAGGDALVRKVARLFLAAVTSGLQDLRWQLANGNGEAAAFRAHALRSNFASMGAMRAVPICEVLEEAAAHGDLPAAQKQMAAMEIQAAQALAEAQRLARQ